MCGSNKNTVNSQLSGVLEGTSSLINPEHS